MAPLSGPIAPELVGELTLLFKSLAFRETDEGETTVRFRLYADALRGLPLAEVSSIMRAFRIGDLGDGRWVPKPAEIRQAVLNRMERAAAGQRQERLIAEQIAQRHASDERGPKSEQERATAAAMVERLKAELSQGSVAGPAPKRQPTEQEAKEWLEAHEGGAGLPPVTTFSSGLIDQLMGKRPIGQGAMGCRPLMTEEQRRAYEDAKFAEMDQYARDTL